MSRPVIGPMPPVPIVTPFALVRVAALPYPMPGPAAAAFRKTVRKVRQLHLDRDELATPLGDALYASAAGHDVAFHRGVVLPLRRDVYNGRSPVSYTHLTLPTNREV